MSQITFALQQDRMGWEIVIREKKEEQDKSLGFTTQNKPEILGFTTYMCLNHHQAYRNNFNLKILIQSVRDRAPGPFYRMLGQTHVNGWSCVIASQNGGSIDYIFPLRLGVLQWSRHLFNYWKNKKTIIEKFLILLI